MKAYLQRELTTYIESYDILSENGRLTVERQRNKLIKSWLSQKGGLIDQANISIRQFHDYTMSLFRDHADKEVINYILRGGARHTLDPDFKIVEPEVPNTAGPDKAAGAMIPGALALFGSVTLAGGGGILLSAAIPVGLVFTIASGILATWKYKELQTQKKQAKRKMIEVDIPMWSKDSINEVQKNLRKALEDYRNTIVRHIGDAMDRNREDDRTYRKELVEEFADDNKFLAELNEIAVTIQRIKNSTKTLIDGIDGEIV